MSVVGIIKGGVDLVSNITGGAVGRKQQQRQLEMLQYESMSQMQQMRYMNKMQKEKQIFYMSLAGGGAILTLIILKKMRKKNVKIPK